LYYSISTEFCIVSWLLMNSHARKLTDEFHALKSDITHIHGASEL